MSHPIPSITLEELLSLTPDTTGKKLPTEGQLRRAGAKILLDVETGQGRLTAYGNGYFSYRAGNRVTIQSIHRCTHSVRYAQDTALDLSVFARLPAAIRLTLEGEARLDENQRARDAGRVYSYDNIALESAALEDPTDFAKALTRRMDAQALRKAIRALSAPQREAVYLYYGRGLSHRKIASRLGISKSAVQERLSGAIKKLRRTCASLNC